MSSPTSFQYPKLFTQNHSNNQSINQSNNLYKFNPASPSNNDENDGFQSLYTAPESPSNFTQSNNQSINQSNNQSHHSNQLNSQSSSQSNQSNRGNDSFQNYALLPTQSINSSSSSNLPFMWNQYMNSLNNQNRDQSINQSINPMLSMFLPQNSNSLPFPLPLNSLATPSGNGADPVSRIASPSLENFASHVNQPLNPYTLASMWNNSGFPAQNPSQSSSNPNFLKYMDPNAAASQFQALMMGSINIMGQSSNEPVFNQPTDPSTNLSVDSSSSSAFPRYKSGPYKSGRVYMCTFPSCGESLKTRFSLKRHMKKHTGEKPHTCPYAGCMKSFPEASTLKRHVRIHTGEKPFRCKFDCGKTFADATNVKRHEMTHTGEKPYKCFLDGCGRSFSRGSSLKQHMASLHKCEPSIIAYSLRRGQAVKQGDAREVQQQENSINLSIKQFSGEVADTSHNPLASSIPASQQLIDALLAEEDDEGEDSEAGEEQ